MAKKKQLCKRMKSPPSRYIVVIYGLGVSCRLAAETTYNAAAGIKILYPFHFFFPHFLTSHKPLVLMSDLSVPHLYQA